MKIRYGDPIHDISKLSDEDKKTDRTVEIRLDDSEANAAHISLPIYMSGEPAHNSGSFTTSAAIRIALPAGEHELTFVFTNGHISFNWFELELY